MFDPSAQRSTTAEGDGRARFIEFDPHEVLHQQVETYKLQLATRHMNLEFQPSVSCPSRAYGDPRRLAMILRSVVSTAIELTYEGHVIVGVSLERTQEHSHLKFSVRGVSSRKRSRTAPAKQTHPSDAMASTSYGGDRLSLMSRLKTLRGMAAITSVRGHRSRKLIIEFEIPVLLPPSQRLPRPPELDSAPPSSEQWSAHLREVRGITGCQFAELVSMFAGGGQCTLRDMRDALAAHDIEALRAATQRLRNASAILGVGLLASTCKVLEDDLAISCLTRAEDLLKVIQISFDASITMLTLYVRDARH